MDSAHAKMLYDTAKGMYRNGQFQKSLDILAELEASFRNDPQVLLARARCLCKLERQAEALAICDKLIGESGNAKASALKSEIFMLFGPAPAGSPLQGAVPAGNSPKRRGRRFVLAAAGAIVLVLICGPLLHSFLLPKVFKKGETAGKGEVSEKSEISAKLLYSFGPIKREAATCGPVDQIVVGGGGTSWTGGYAHEPFEIPCPVSGILIFELLGVGPRTFAKVEINGDRECKVGGNTDEKAVVDRIISDPVQLPEDLLKGERLSVVVRVSYFADVYDNNGIEGMNVYEAQTGQ